VAVAPSALYRVRPDDGLRHALEALLGPGALVLSGANGSRNGVSALSKAG
jgi:hypothetical protein